MPKKNVDVMKEAIQEADVVKIKVITYSLVISFF